VVRQGSGIAGAMQNANDHDLSLVVQIVDSIVAGETDAQARCKILTRRRGVGKMAHGLAVILDLVDQARRRRL
jgi:hypothetical protein